jgi:hypothetical protein
LPTELLVNPPLVLEMPTFVSEVAKVVNVSHTHHPNPNVLITTSMTALLLLAFLLPVCASTSPFQTELLATTVNLALEMINALMEPARELQ